jgi:hypothetical protein
MRYDAFAYYWEAYKVIYFFSLTYQQGNTMLVGMLLEAKADTLLANKDGFGAHSIAQFEGFPAIAAYIATEGVKACMVTEDFVTMLLMIADGASVNTRNSAGWTPLIAAVSAGHEATVMALLNTPDVDLNLAENDGWTPLMFAANNNRPQITQWLIERGADVSIKSRMGFTAMGIARDRNFADVVTLMKKAAAVRNRYLTELKQLQAQAQPQPQPDQEQQEKPQHRLRDVEQEVGVEQAFFPQTQADYKAHVGPAVLGNTQPQSGPAMRKEKDPAALKKKSGWLW